MSSDTPANPDKTKAQFTIIDGDYSRPINGLVRLFEKSFQAGEGAGLDLAIVKKLVELYGGGIAYTGAHGAGGSFEVTLPAAEVSANAQNRAARRHASCLRSVRAGAKAQEGVIWG